MEENLIQNKQSLISKKTVAGVLILIAVTFFIYIRNQGNNVQQVSNPVSVRTADIQNDEKRLLQWAKLVFPDIKSTTLIDPKNVPDKLLPLLDGTYGSIKPQVSEALVYKDGSKGYRLSAPVPVPFESSFNFIGISIRKNKYWTRLTGSKTNIYGFWDIESVDYKVRFSSEYIDKDNSHITVLVLKKQK